MKKLIFLELTLIFILMLASCNEGAKFPDDAESIIEADKVAVMAVDDIREYKVVRGDNTSEEEKAVAVDFHQTLYKTFREIKITTDFNSAEKEILIGKTNRPESISAAEGLHYHEFVIKKTANKIIIVGGSTEALRTAVGLFKAKLFDSESAKVLMPVGDGYKYTVEYAMDRLSVSGVDISEFELYNNSVMKIDEIKDKLHLGLGIDFAVAAQMLEDKHYIIFDGSDLIADKYSITISDGNIIIHGSAHSLPLAIDIFTGSYLEELGKRTYDLKEKNSIEGSVGKKEIYTKDQLMTIIEQVYADPDHVIVGQQLPGKTKPYIFEEAVNEYKAATGQMPGIVGIDLACYGIDLMETSDLEWSSYICDIVDYCADGGIVTISAHWENPSQNYNGGARCRGNFGYVNNKEGYEKAFTELLTEGTEYNTFWMKEVNENLRFLKALMDNGVPVIWRPLHEANGNFFWYCIRQGATTLEPSYVTNIWKFIHKYFTEDCGLTNLIWNYAPNYSPNVDNKPGAHMSNTYLYPGDEYVDMVGVDWYSGGKMEITENDNYLELVRHAGKPGAITEFGPGGDVKAEKREDQSELFNCLDLYGNLYALSKEGYSFVYVMTWTGDSGVEVLGEGEAYLNQEMTLSQSEVKAMFDALK